MLRNPECRKSDDVLGLSEIGGTIHRYIKFDGLGGAVTHILIPHPLLYVVSTSLETDERRWQ
jgi:hypothetical protein